MISNERIVFMGSPEISAFYLQSLINSRYNIVAVYSQPPQKKRRGMKIQESFVQKLAQSKNINVFTPKDLHTETSKKELQDLNALLLWLVWKS